MSSKARKRFKDSTGPSLTDVVSAHSIGGKLQRIEFNFGVLLARFGGTLYGVDMAPDRVILHCTPDSQANFELANHKVIENLVDTGVIPAQESAPRETPAQGTPS